MVYLIKTLFYTQSRSDVLLIEGLRSKSVNDQKLVITGNLGPVGHEAARVAHALHCSIFPGVAHFNYHINFEYPSLKKDGSCWGLACFLLLNFMSGTLPYVRDITAIGELNLRGEVLPIRNICDKTAAWAKSESDYLFLPKQGYQAENVFEVQHVNQLMKTITAWGCENVCDSA